MSELTQTILQFFQGRIDDPYLLLFLISMTPVIELRGAIILSVAMEVQALPATLCCVAGSSIIILPILLTVRPIINGLKRSKRLSRIAEKIESGLMHRAQSVGNSKAANAAAISEPSLPDRNEPNRTEPSQNKPNHSTPPIQKRQEERKFAKKPNRERKFWGLLLFVGIPLPLTGAWTGSAIGSFLNLSIPRAAFAVFLGNLLAGLILAIIVRLFAEYVDVVLIAFLTVFVFLGAVLLWVKMIKARRCA